VDKRCLSWQFGPGRCTLGDAVRLGKKMDDEVKESVLEVSGWNVERIQRWKERIPCG
jgi:hypothetical protein